MTGQLKYKSGELVDCGMSASANLRYDGNEILLDRAFGRGGMFLKR